MPRSPTRTSGLAATLAVATLAIATAAIATAALAWPAEAAITDDPPPFSAESLVVSPRWLAARLDDPAVVVLHVTHSKEEPRTRVPGARAVSYHDFTASRGDLRTELPDAAQLVALFEGVGVSDDSHVIVYSDDPVMSARALFTLEFIGHRRASLLDGGLDGWRAEGGRVATAAPVVTRGRITTAPSPDVVADASWIVERLGRPGIALLDTRTDEEYHGTGGRRGIPSEGHLEGAHQLQWEQLFHPRSHRLRDRDQLARLYAERVRPGDTVVTYCWIGYRASATWFVARWLGYDARMYDGSYQDWSQRRLPVVR